MLRTYVRMRAANSPIALPSGDRVFSAFLRGLYLISIVGLVALLVRGWGYYTTPFAERPFHPDYLWFRPAGRLGQGFGVVGSGLILLLLSYSIRKRSRGLSRFGSTRRWLALHIYCGVVGPLLIVLHSSFKVTGLVAVSFWAMVAVAVSGVLGRYLYQQIPRTVLGHALAPEEARRVENELDRTLRERCGVDDGFLRGLEGLARGGLGSRSLLLTVLSGAVRDAWIRPAVGRYLGTHGPAGLRPEQQAVLRTLTLEKARLHRRLHRLSQYQTAFHYWHVVHKPFAVIMLLIMGIHIAVAIALGYTWIF